MRREKAIPGIPLTVFFFTSRTDGSVTVVGTDGHRLALIKRNIAGAYKEERKLIIPRKAAAELRKLLDKHENNVRMTLCKNHVLFSIGEIQFLTRLIEGTYPNYEQVIPSANEKRGDCPGEAFVKTRAEWP